MECNKEEATRAKEIAEKKFAAKDMLGAKKFALKAQQMYPEMKGIPQMIAALDVYASAENKVNGESDWYGILGVNPLADDDTVRKHYRKLALMLHPDKNDFVGADGAFKLISEAWGLLSDKAKRVAYDQRRSVHLYQKVSFQPNGVASTTPGSNGFCNFSKSTAHFRPPASCDNPEAYTWAASTTAASNEFCNFSKPSVKTRRRTSKVGHSGSPASSYKPEVYTGGASTFPASSEFCNFRKSGVDTNESTRKAGYSANPTSSLKSKHDKIWTECTQCKSQSQYLRFNLNHNLLCPNCKEPFIVVEIVHPPSNGTISRKPPQQLKKSYQGAGKRKVVFEPKEVVLGLPSTSSGFYNTPKRRRGMEDIGPNRNAKSISSTKKEKTAKSN